MNLNIDVLCASHPDELFGSVAHNRIQAEPAPGIRSHIVHPDALAAGGARFLGTSEIMGHYPGDLLGDPEDVAAATTMTWLGEHAGSNEALVYDVHNSASGAHFQEVGAYAMKASIAGAYMFGFDTCIVRPDSFYDTVPNAVALEFSISNQDANGQSDAAEQLYKKLVALSTIDIADLTAAYETIAPNLRFLTKHSVCITQPPGQPNEQRLLVPDSETLDHLEAIPFQPGIAELQLPEGLRTAIGINDEGALYQSGWQYYNQSPTLPDQGSYNDQPRRLVIGDIYRRTEQPIVVGDWVRFKEL